MSAVRDILSSGLLRSAGWFVIDVSGPMADIFLLDDGTDTLSLKSGNKRAYVHNTEDRNYIAARA
jgi:hypothetical protein